MKKSFLINRQVLANEIKRAKLFFVFIRKPARPPKRAVIIVITIIIS